MAEKMKLIIIIEGESAEELFPVGPTDLKEYFLPERLNVKQEDVKSIRFRKVLKRAENGLILGEHKHIDNF